MEQDLGTKLQWVAIEHTDKEHKHVHVLLRGARQELDRNGRCMPLTMDREYITGLRYISAELVQRELGPMTERQYLEARSRAIEGERWTELDRAIERRLENGVADYRFAAWLSERSRTRVEQEMERLAYLEGRGLADSLGDNCWLVRDDFKQQLKDLQLSHDVIKSRGREHIRRREQGRERGLEQDQEMA
jgi:type IV secretory pathway VirD2 relaxase